MTRDTLAADERGDAGEFASPAARPWLRRAVVFAVWTFFGLLNATQFYVGLRSEGFQRPFAPLFAWQMLNWYGWALLTPVILWLGRRVPLTRARWALALAAHLLFCFALMVAHTAFATSVMYALRPFGPQSDPRGFASLFLGGLTSQFHLSVLIYAMVVGLSYALDYYTKFRERESRAAQLEARLAQAELQALKMQLHPHFLFNTLNGIAGLVRDKRDKDAVRMLAGLSDLLRHTLETAGKQEVSLREELEFLELYLDLQQMRFPDRLNVRMEIEPETLDAVVPYLVLQPLVENAVRHGIAPRAAPGTVGVSARRDDSLLEIKVFDDGLGLSKSAGAGKGTGIGLANTRARLAQLYGERQRFDVREREGGGVEATLVIPFRPRAEELEA